MDCKFCKLTRDLEKRGDTWRDIAVALAISYSLTICLMALAILIE